MQDIDALLHQAGEINEIYLDKYKSTGKLYNIFSILGVAEEERRVCRFICDLLNPKGLHYHGIEFLKAFVENVLDQKNKYTDQDYENALVLREYYFPSDQKNFIDILINIGNAWIPIEVKINAEDQELQLERYYNFALSKDQNARVIYLTKNGDAPSSESKGNLNEDKIICISFKNNIIDWLSYCLYGNGQLPDTIRITIEQMIITLSKITGKGEIGIMDEIDDLIKNSSRGMKNALLISQAFIKVNTDMIIRCFESLKSRIEDSQELSHLVLEKCDYKKAETYYSKKNYPNIIYKLGMLEGDNHICFVIELDEKLYAGFYLADNNGLQPLSHFPDDIIKKAYKRINMDIKTARQTIWSLHYQYLPNEITTPDFRNYNDHLFNLYDNFDQFIKACIDEINVLVQKINLVK